MVAGWYAFLMELVQASWSIFKISLSIYVEWSNCWEFYSLKDNHLVIAITFTKIFNHYYGLPDKTYTIMLDALIRVILLRLEKF